MKWETVSNATERSRRMRAAISPLSRIIWMLSVVVMIAVSVLCLGLKPDCMVSSSWLVLRCAVGRLLMSFSKTLAGYASGEIGL